MANRKSVKKYYFSVEGETEFWYLKWLQELINTTEESTYKVSFDCPVQKNPYKRAKIIMQRNEENGYTQHQYKGYKYYKENPSLAIWETIERILKDCELI